MLFEPLVHIALNSLGELECHFYGNRLAPGSTDRLRYGSHVLHTLHTYALRVMLFRQWADSQGSRNYLPNYHQESSLKLVKIPHYLFLAGISMDGLLKMLLCMRKLLMVSIQICV